MAAVVQEYLAGRHAADWLASKTVGDASYGWKHGFESVGGEAFVENLEATYIIRLYAEFEAGIRDYWESYRGRNSRPDMITLVRQAVPTEAFSQDCIDDADEVREYRNFLVHDMGKVPPPGIVAISLKDVKRRLSGYFARINPRWR
jgi:hypothetical protein